MKEYILFNSEREHSFVYAIEGLTEVVMPYVDDKSKEFHEASLHRLYYLGARFYYLFFNGKCFLENIRLIDSRMDDLLAYCTLHTQLKGPLNTKTLLQCLEDDDPLGYANPIAYRYKLSELLLALYFGLNKEDIWDGQDLTHTLMPQEKPSFFSELIKKRQEVKADLLEH